jgi:hypothetical protein
MSQSRSASVTRGRFFTDGVAGWLRCRVPTAVMAQKMLVMELWQNQIKRHGKDVLYMLNNFDFNSGDGRYVHSVNSGRYLAGFAPGRRQRSWRCRCW